MTKIIYDIACSTQLRSGVSRTCEIINNICHSFIINEAYKCTCLDACLQTCLCTCACVSLCVCFFVFVFAHVCFLFFHEKGVWSIDIFKCILGGQGWVLGLLDLLGRRQAHGQGEPKQGNAFYVFLGLRLIPPICTPVWAACSICDPPKNQLPTKHEMIPPHPAHVS